MNIDGHNGHNGPMSKRHCLHSIRLFDKSTYKSIIIIIYKCVASMVDVSRQLVAHTKSLSRISRIRKKHGFSCPPVDIFVNDSDDTIDFHARVPRVERKNAIYIVCNIVKPNRSDFRASSNKLT